MLKRLNFMLAIGLVFTVFACYPGGAEFVDELDTSISKFDGEYAWNELSGKTYSIPDKITYVKDGKPVLAPDRKHDAAIKAQLREEYGNLGMTEVAEGVDPNIAVAITIIEQNNTGAAWIPGGGWWGGYPGWGWGGYYPWYPVYYSFKTGSVVIEKGDFDNRDEVEETIPLIYSGVLDGLLQGSDDYIGDRIERGIDELFNQVPFN